MTFFVEVAAGSILDTFEVNLMDGQVIAGAKLVELADPYLIRGDKEGLATALQSAWSPECLELLLETGDDLVVEVAAICLGLIGQMAFGQPIAGLLHHAHPRIVAAAEDALWSIWFRDGGSLGCSVLSRISSAIEGHETENAEQMLTELIRVMPAYGEAYHQRGQVHFLNEAYTEALRDARRAFELNPLHFGALAQQGHALSATGHGSEAIKIYRQVLQLHPRMAGIRECISCLRAKAVLAEA